MVTVQAPSNQKRVSTPLDTLPLSHWTFFYHSLSAGISHSFSKITFLSELRLIGLFPGIPKPEVPSKPPSALHRLDLSSLLPLPCPVPQLNASHGSLPGNPNPILLSRPTTRYCSQTYLSRRGSQDQILPWASSCILLLSLHTSLRK